jgi:protease-4
MKDFFKFTLASVLGIVLAGIIFTIIGIVSLVGMVASSDTETKVQEYTILCLNLEGVLSERVESNPLQELMGETFASYGLDDILNSIQKAKDNENIKGIYLQPSVFAAEYPSLEEIRKALADFKESGKFIVAYSDQYTQEMYYLASVADKIIVNCVKSVSEN